MPAHECKSSPRSWTTYRLGRAHMARKYSKRKGADRHAHLVLRCGITVCGAPSLRIWAYLGREESYV